MTLTYEERCIQAYNTVAACGGDYEQAALSLNVPVRTLRDRVKAARPFIPEAAPDEPAEPVQPVAKPRVRVRAVTHETPPDGPIYRVTAIGDLHDAPGQRKDRFRWIGQHIAETKPDRVVQIGDWGTFDSMGTHDAPGSRKSMEHPSFAQDLESLEESMAAMSAGMGEFDCPRDITFGNHEERVWRAANGDPKRLGDAPLRVEQVFARWGWKSRLYGEYLFIGGVGFTHCPKNQIGKEYAGKRPENVIGNELIFSLVYGHTHKRGFWTFPKIGPQRRVDLLNLGSGMEHGHVENYAKMSTTGWSWGLYDLTIQSGQIISDRFTSMLELSQRYDRKEAA
jgi:hypothetical protein